MFRYNGPDNPTYDPAEAILTDAESTPSGIVRETYKTFAGPALVNPETGEIEGVERSTVYRYSKFGAQVGCVEWRPTACRKGVIVVYDYDGSVMAQLHNVAHVYVLMILGGGIKIRRSAWVEVCYVPGRLTVHHRTTRAKVVELEGAPISAALDILKGSELAQSTGKHSVGATVHKYRKAAVAAQQAKWTGLLAA